MNGVSEILDDGQCALLERPISQDKCNTHNCRAHWKVEPWDECSQTCGGGFKSRKVSCFQGDEHLGGFTNEAQVFLCLTSL